MAAANASFASLRMSPTEFACYKADRQDEAPALSDDGTRLVKVTGYGNDAEDAIVAANSAGDTVIEVPWRTTDKVLSIIQRVEDKLLIPEEHWDLAREGLVLQPDTIVGDHELFKDDIVELVLVPSDMLEYYEEDNPHPVYVWNHLEPGTTDSAVPLEQAKAKYHLLSPVTSTYWGIYAWSRTVAGNELNGFLTEDNWREYKSEVRHIKDSVERVVRTFHLEEEQQLAVADGVLPQSLIRNETGDGYPSEITTFTRIYSPTKPAAVDVYFIYHYRTRWQSVDFHSSLLFRIHDPLTDVGVAKAGEPEAPNGRVAHGWTRMFWMALDDDVPPGRHWQPKRVQTWGMGAADVNRLHRALFGRADRAPGAAVDKVDMVRLLLAAVGVPLGVAREEAARDELSPGGFRWEGLHAQWIGMNIREACGVPLDGDAGWQMPEEQTGCIDDYEEEE